MPKDYTYDNAQYLLEHPDLRKLYVDQLMERVRDKTQRFPQIIYLHDFERQVNFISLLAVIENQPLQRLLLKKKVEFTAKRLKVEDKPKLRHFVINRMEDSLADADSVDAHRAQARIDRLRSATPAVDYKSFHRERIMTDERAKPSNWQKFVKKHLYGPEGPSKN